MSAFPAGNWQLLVLHSVASCRRALVWGPRIPGGKPASRRNGCLFTQNECQPATTSRGSLCPGKGKHWRSVPEVSLAAHQREFHLKVVLLEPRELQLCGELWCRHPATQHAEFGFFSTSAPQCKSQSAPGSLTHGCALSSHRTLT